MSDRFVISHSGKKGGPWEARVDYPVGTSTADESKPERGEWLSREDADFWVHAMRALHPSAKVFRLVRRSKASLATLERAVVEAAEQWEEGYSSLDALGEKYSRRRAALAAAVRALRAKRGG